MDSADEHVEQKVKLGQRFKPEQVSPSFPSQSQFLKSLPVATYIYVYQTLGSQVKRKVGGKLMKSYMGPSVEDPALEV